jgi:hypothetical protein
LCPTPVSKSHPHWSLLFWHPLPDLFFLFMDVEWYTVCLSLFFLT